MRKALPTPALYFLVPFLQGCGIGLYYNGTISYADTKMYARYTTLPVATYLPDPVSLKAVDAIYFDSWLGSTVRTHATEAASYHEDARHWKGPSPYVTGVSQSGHLMWTTDMLQNPETRIVGSVSLDSLGFFRKDSIATETCNAYFPAVLQAAVQRVADNAATVSGMPGHHWIGPLMNMENNRFAGSVYDVSGFPMPDVRTTSKYILVVTLENMWNRYAISGAKAHHSLLLKLYVVDRASGRIVGIKFMEFLLHLDMKPIESYPTAAEFRKSKEFRFYLLAVRELLTDCFADTPARRR